MAFSNIIARLGVSLGLDTASFTTGSRKAQKEAKGLQGSMQKMATAAKVVAGAFAGSIVASAARQWSDATHAALEFAGSLGETAQQLGVTTDELQEYRYVASQVGIDQEVMDKGLAKLSITLGDVAAGAKAPTAALKALGLSAKEITDIGKMTAGQALPVLADAFAKLKSPTEQAAIAADLFGAKLSGKFMTLLGLGADGLRKMREEAQRLGIVISEEAIKNADVNADLVTTYEKIAEAQKNAALVLPENVKAYVEYRKAVTDLQVSLYKAVGSLSAFTAAYQKQNDEWTESLAPFRKSVVDFFSSFNTAVSNWARNTHDTIVAIPKWVGDMTMAISRWISGTLGAVWNTAIKGIKDVGNAFAWLYDVVVGHSYVPDMVDGIAAHMARLDAVMVEPAKKGAKATADAMRDMARETLAILDRLFPEIAARQQMLQERTLLGGISDPAVREKALRALALEFDNGNQRDRPDIDFGAGEDELAEGMDGVGDAIENLTERARIGTVRIAKSFADMAESTLQSLSGLANAIKGGGFFDILENLIGVGLQLGQAGAFGGSIQGFLNSTPGSGSSLGSLKMVGNSKLSLASAPSSSKLAPSSASAVKVIISPSEYFNATVDGRAAKVAAPMAAGAAQTGGAIGYARTARRVARTIP